MSSDQRRIILGGIVFAVVVVLFFVLRGVGDRAGDEVAENAGTTGATTVNAEDLPAPPNPLTVTVRNGKPVGGPRPLNFSSSGLVRFRVVSDTPGEVHVHGYDETLPVKAGRPLDLTFQAELEGSFEVELHAADGGHAEIAKLNVQPG